MILNASSFLCSTLRPIIIERQIRLLAVSITINNAWLVNVGVDDLVLMDQ